MLIGAHVGPDDPIGTATAEGADCVQLFLGDPQSWKKPPKPRDDADAAAGLAGARLRPRALSHQPGVTQQPGAHPVAEDPAADRVTRRRRSTPRRSSCTAAMSPRTTTRRPASSAGTRRSTQLETDRARLPREHRGRRPRHGPALRHHRQAVGPHRRVRHRVLPRHLPRPRRGRGRVAGGRPHQVDHRPDRPGALQRLEGRPRLGPRPPRAPRSGQIDPRPWSRWCATAGAPVICETSDDGRKDDIVWLRDQLLRRARPPYWLWSRILSLGVWVSGARTPGSSP